MVGKRAVYPVRRGMYVSEGKGRILCENRTVMGETEQEQLTFGFRLLLGCWRTFDSMSRLVTLHQLNSAEFQAG